MLTPLDIQNKVFKKGIRGYSMQEVDEFLNLVIEGYEKLYKDNIDNRDKITMLKEKVDYYKSMEDTLQSTLVVAQSAGEQVQRNAAEKAENIIHDAQNKAQQIIYDAHSKVQKLTYKYEDMKRGIGSYRSKMIALLDFQLDILKNIKTTDETMTQLTGVSEALETLDEIKNEMNQHKTNEKKDIDMQETMIMKAIEKQDVIEDIGSCDYISDEDNNLA